MQKAWLQLGLKDISANELVSLKSLGITSGYVKDFQNNGFKESISANELDVR